MASGQGGVGAVSALQSHHYSSGPHWSPGNSQYQHQQQHHTARSLDRALEDAVCSGFLNLSGRKLREYPGMSYDLTDTTQAGGSLVCVHGKKIYSKKTPTRPKSFCASCDKKMKNTRAGLCAYGGSVPALCVDLCLMFWIEAH